MKAKTMIHFYSIFLIHFRIKNPQNHVINQKKVEFLINK